MDTLTSPTELAAVPCSGPPGFGWVVRGHPQWEDWNAWNDRILVRTGDGFFVVYVPEDGFPEYEHLDELADPDEWEAWSAIPRVQNTEITQPTKKESK